MRTLYLALSFLFMSSLYASTRDKPMSLEGFQTLKFDLKYPLLVIKGSKGFLSCAYINPDVCTQKTDEACAIVSGVKTHEDMLSAKILKASQKAQELGVVEGMTGSEALKLFK